MKTLIEVILCLAWPSIGILSGFIFISGGMRGIVAGIAMIAISYAILMFVVFNNDPWRKK